MSIEIRNVSKRFGTFQAVDDVTLDVEGGSLTALLGPSGSGKSTLLRIVAGLETPDTGEIRLAGEDATELTPQKRGVGFVFQHYAAFKHMTVRQNVAFGLAVRKRPKDEIRARVAELLELVQLTGFGDRFPEQLSGGQRQRMALARALAPEPKVLLLDEPFGALDARVRAELRVWLRRLHEETHTTTVFVTHDQEEAMEVADKIVVMNKGQIEQVGTAAEIYDRPASAFVMSFIGPVNVLPSSADIFQNNGFEATHPQVFLRPQDISIETKPESNMTVATVRRIIHLGWEIQAELALTDGQVISAHLTRDRFDELQLVPQQTVYIKPKEAKSFPLYYSI